MDIILTGGTFFKIYDESKQELVLKEKRMLHRVEDILYRGRTHNHVIWGWSATDSKNMTLKKRDDLYKFCINTSKKRCPCVSGTADIMQRRGHKQVIIHGTDTLAETAKHFYIRFKKNPRPYTIVFTGAMIPYDVHYSDAMFNFAFAMGCVTNTPPGVYVAMNGKLFQGNSVQKIDNEFRGNIVISSKLSKEDNAQK